MSLLPYEVIEALAALGLGVTSLVAGLLIYMIYLWLKDQLVFLYKRHKDKKFAQKCPKPRCYCIQCEYWHASESTRETGLCCIWEKWTSANEMCARGYLRSKEEYKNEEWRMEN